MHEEMSAWKGVAPTPVAVPRPHANRPKTGMASMATTEIYVKKTNQVGRAPPARGEICTALRRE